MLSQLIEAKIVAAIDAALVAAGIRDKVQLFGAWQPSAVGVVKASEDTTLPASLAVAVGTAQRETFSLSTVAFSGAVGLTVRLDLDANGNHLLAIGDALEALFLGWQGDTYQQAFTALDVEDRFRCGDIALDSGRPPVIDFARHTIAVAWPFTLRGVTPAASEQPTT